jgi:hypothetical protein
LLECPLLMLWTALHQPASLQGLAEWKRAVHSINSRDPTPRDNLLGCNGCMVQAASARRDGIGEIASRELR